MPVWIIVGYLVGSNIPLASYIDYAYVSPDACEARRFVAASDADAGGAKILLTCQRLVLKK